MKEQHGGCGTCMSWDECGSASGIRFGMCRRFPPQYIGETPTTTSGWQQPVTTELLSCREWTPANPQSERDAKTNSSDDTVPLDGKEDDR